MTALPGYLNPEFRTCGLDTGPFANFRACVRPVIAYTGVAEAPFAILGTAFMVTLRKKAFVVTAKHVIGDVELRHIKIFANDSASAPLKLSTAFALTDVGPDEELADLIAFEIGGSSPASQLAACQMLNLVDRRGDEWHDGKFVHQFWLAGYPHNVNEVDYVGHRVHTNQVVLAARYKRPGFEHFLHELSIANPLDLPSFSGVSGGPVFSVDMQFGYYGVNFCGLVVRGGATSGTVHFIDAVAVKILLEEAEIGPSR